MRTSARGETSYAAGGRARLVALAVLLVLLAIPAVAAARPATKLVRYRGIALRVPARWPVVALARDPSACVRFNRHAVYLGRPAQVQRCPAVAIGRTEAILISPAPAGRLLGTHAPAATGSPFSLVLRAGGLTITATWRSDPAAIRAALGPLWRAARARHAAAAQVVPARVAPAQSGGVGLGSTGATGATGSTGATSGGAASVYTGLGFDGCQDPSPAQLDAWLGSPYRAFGLYIGGANMACSQPNLSASYVSTETAAGWHLIPTYVGLQAPSNSCSCAAITATKAAAQGTAAADDAVSIAQANGIGAGSPIYYDMEAYPSGQQKITTTVLTFISAWTTELHARGYQSGVYSSAGSGISDMAAAAGSSYALPDDLWIAEWNGQQSTISSSVPAADWNNHQRLHQYEGANNETYGKVTMNVDNDYIDGATVGATTAVGGPLPVPAPSSPTLAISPQPDGSINLTGAWTGTSGITGWRLLGGATPTALTQLTGALPSGQIVSHSAFPYFAEQALGAGGQVLGTSPATATPPHLAIYGRSMFVPASGWAGLPVGCFTGSTCHLVITVSSGERVLAQTKPERVASGASGLVYLAPNATGRRLLAAAAHHRLAVTVSIRDISGATAAATLKMIGFATAGAAPARSATQGTTLKVVGLEDFVAGGGFGGILAECVAAAPCRAQVTLSSGATTLAQSGAEFMGANELSYLSFRLTPQARSMLAAAHGGMLPAQLKLTVTGDAATAQIVLIRY